VTQQVTPATEGSSGDFDSVVFGSALVRVGRFRCPIGHPQFPDSGPAQNYCFVFPRTSVWIEHEGDRPFVADPNVIPFYNQGQPYRRGAISEQGDRTDWFGVSPDCLREMLTLHDPDAANHPERLFRFSFGPAMPRTFVHQRAVFDYVVAQQAPDVLLVEESVVGLLARVLADAYGQPLPLTAARHHRDVVEDARAYLAKTYRRRENLSELAAAIGVSVFHLCRVFRRLTGWTLHHYRNHLRLRNSFELLGDAGGDILTVAIELGYSGHSHFTAAFRQAFGMSPSTWRSRRARERSVRALESASRRTRSTARFPPTRERAPSNGHAGGRGAHRRRR
jgi:AraC-like DNA-binding protein